MFRSIKFACLQIEPKPNFNDALDEALDLAEIAVKEGAKFLCLPEYCGGLLTKSAAFIPPSEKEENHPVLSGLVDFAKKNSVYLLIGSIAIKDDSGKIINRSIILNDKGQIISRYDKIHLFDVNLSGKQTFRESAFVLGGNELSVCKTHFGILGQTICYDIRFPYLYRELAQQGAEILFIPAVFTKKTGQAHWNVLNRSRAIENCSFVISPCAVGKVEGGGEGYGHSLMINPWGEVLSDGGKSRGVNIAEINLDKVKEARFKIPSLEHDKSYKFKSVTNEIIK